MWIWGERSGWITNPALAAAAVGAACVGCALYRNKEGINRPNPSDGSGGTGLWAALVLGFLLLALLLSL